MGRHVARMGEMRNAYKILVGNSVEMKPFGKPWCSSEDNDNNIRMGHGK